MTIWIDGDACPKPIKEILFKAAVRTRTPLVLVSNHYSSIPPSPFIKLLQVSLGFDVADKTIVSLLAENDLVVTADIPLANDIVDKGAFALNPRGEFYTTNNIKQHLCARNVNESLRSSGMIQSNCPAISAKQIQGFANSLDKYLLKK